MPTGVFAVSGSDTTGDATGALTSRAANDVIGALQVSTLVTANADTLTQNWGHRRFVSAPLAATTFAAADGNWTGTWARSESNTNHSGSFSLYVTLWRPSTGARVGTVRALVSGGVLLATGELTDNISGAWNGTQAILDGDILVFEVAESFTQSMSTAYTSSFYYDGTTEASTTSCASFVTPPAALTLYAPPARHPNQFAPIPFVAPGRI